VQSTVGESDNVGCDVLLRTLGGPAKAEKYIRSIGVKDMAIATTEVGQQVADQMVQYKNWATPAAMTQLLKIFWTGKALSAKSTALLMKYMIESTPGKNRLKGLLPAGTIVAHKTGTSSTVDGMTRATNDAGIVTLPNGHHLAITVFVSDSHADEADRELTIAQMARAAWDHWVK
jgi:beta-lactamase class A